MQCPYSLIELEEGFKSRAYLDTKGYPTIGSGFLITKQEGIDVDKIEIIIPEAANLIMIRNYVMQYLPTLQKLIWFNKLNDVRQDIIVSMCYQMGLSKVMKFTDMVGALKTGNFEKASAEMIDSVWHKDTRGRCERHAAVMKTGKYSPDWYTTLRGLHNEN